MKLQFDHVVRKNNILSVVLVFRLCVYSFYYQRINTFVLINLLLQSSGARVRHKASGGRANISRPNKITMRRRQLEKNVFSF